MENRNLEKALDIVTALFMGEDVKAGGANAMLYDEYSHNSEVYDCVVQILKRFDINLYEYNDSLFISAGADNRVFGYSNEELKKIMGLRLYNISDHNQILQRFHDRDISGIYQAGRYCEGCECISRRNDRSLIRNRDG